MIGDGCSTLASFLVDVGLPMLAMVVVIIILVLALLGALSLADHRGR